MEVYDRFISNLFHVFRNSPNITNTLTILAVPLQDSFDAIDYLKTQIDIDDADGVHLDILGELLGVPRPLAQEANLLEFIAYADLPGTPATQGLREYSDPDTTGGYLVKNGIGLVSQNNPGSWMSDSTYRTLIKARRRSLFQKATRENIYLFLDDLGADCNITDSTNGEIVIVPKVPGAVEHWVQGYFLDKGFKPAGIAVSWAFY